MWSTVSTWYLTFSEHKRFWIFLHCILRTSDVRNRVFTDVMPISGCIVLIYQNKLVPSSSGSAWLFKMKALWFFETSGMTRLIMQCHIPECLNSLQHCFQQPRSCPPAICLLMKKPVTLKSYKTPVELILLSVYVAFIKWKTSLIICSFVCRLFVTW
jgi:hypothetical protein